MSKVITRTMMPAAGQRENEIMALLARLDTDKPQAGDVAALRALFRELPDLWRITGDLVDINLTALLKKVSSQGSVQHSLREGLEVLKRRLCYEQASLLEQLIIDEIALTWLRLQWCEYHLTNAEGSSALFWEKRVSAAQRRFLRASESLARVRKLNIALQVNIATGGGQQVNVQR